MATAAGVLLWSRRTPALTEKDTVLLADFTNTTGDQTFDGTLRQALAVKLEETPFINLFPQSSIGETLQLMERKPDERWFQDLARQVCRRQGLKAMCSGSIASARQPLRRHGQCARTARAATPSPARRARPKQGGRAQRRSARPPPRCAAKLGESLASIEHYDAPVEAATTPSFEALQAFSKGQSLRDNDEDRAAIPLLKRAVDLDPNFALAYARLGAAYSNERQHDTPRARTSRRRTSCAIG